MKKPVEFIVPNGSLSERLREHLGTAGYRLKNPDRSGFSGEVNGIRFTQLDRRMLPKFVQSGVFHVGLTGYDLWLDSGVKNLRSVAKFCFSRTSDQPSRWVLAQRKGYRHCARPRIACELQRLGKFLLKSVKFPRGYRLIRIDGSEEQYVKHGMADMVLVVTETGNSIRENGLVIISDDLLISMPEIRARRDLNAYQEATLEELSLALQAVVGASVFVMVSFDIPEAVNIEKLSLPASVAPTESTLTDHRWKACQTCIPRTKFGSVCRILKNAGAKGIAMQEIQGYLP